MVQIRAIMFRELRAFFMTYLAWVIIALTLTVNGLLAWFSMNRYVQTDRILQNIFYVFSGTTMIAALLTAMRSFAEEFSEGTIELLLTAPVHESRIVTGKFLASTAFILILSLSTLPAPLSVYLLSDAPGGQIIAGYTGVILIGAATVSLSLFYSTLTSSQLLAAVMAAANLVVFLLAGFFSPYLDSATAEVVRSLSFYVHYMNFEKGVITGRHIIFFLSIITFYLYLSRLSLRIRKMRG